MSHHLSELGVWMPFQPAMAAARKDMLGLPPRRGRASPADGQPVLYGFSRHVLEVPPVDRRPRLVTGYWTLPAAPTWSPPPALESFLARGGPVVSIGFGSMASDDPGALTARVLGAIRRAGVRAVLLSGWGGLRSLADADDVFCAEALPHDWLFPRVSAAVHHGGAGTTGAALRAGIPAIVITGANRGIGLALARLFAARGDEVHGTAREPGRATELAAIPGVRVHALDVRSDASCAALASALGSGGVDVLINNAGVGHWEGDDFDPKVAMELFDANALGPVRVTRALVPLLAKAKGKVFHMSSGMGSITDNASGGAYAYPTICGGAGSRRS